jgi:hypothetical protein
VFHWVMLCALSLALDVLGTDHISENGGHALNTDPPKSTPSEGWSVVTDESAIPRLMSATTWELFHERQCGEHDSIGLYGESPLRADASHGN